MTKLIIEAVGNTLEVTGATRALGRVERGAYVIDLGPAFAAAMLQGCRASVRAVPSDPEGRAFVVDMSAHHGTHPEHRIEVVGDEVWLWVAGWERPGFIVERVGRRTNRIGHRASRRIEVYMPGSYWPSILLGVAEAAKVGGL